MAKKIVRKKKEASNVVVFEDWLLGKVLSEYATKREYESRAKYGVTTKGLVEIYFTYSKKHRVMLIDVLMGR